MATGNGRDRRPQPAIHYRDRVDRWPSKRQTISVLAIYRSGDLEIFGKRESDAQRRAKCALSGCRSEHRACHTERWPHVDEACRLSTGQREKSGLGRRAGAKISASGRAGTGTGSLRENSAMCLGARGGEWRASFDEAAADALMKKSPSSRAKLRDSADVTLKVSQRDSSLRARVAFSLGMTKAVRLRELIAKDCVAMPGVPNASIARQVERAGFNAVYISGAGLANCTAGLPDIGLLTLSEVALLAGFVAKAVKIPAIVDADTGFGGAENAARTICELESAGLAGCHLEDQEFPKRCGHLAGKSLIPSADMEEKIAAAVAAKRDKDFLVIARTDARAIESFDGAVKRAQAYVAAGADAIFPEALQTKEEFRDFTKEVEVPLLANMTEFGKSPLLSFDELRELGYRMVIFPQSAFRVSMKSTAEFLRDLKTRESQVDWMEKMQTREELYQLLDYDPKAASWSGARNL